MRLHAAFPPVRLRQASAALALAALLLPPVAASAAKDVPPAPTGYVRMSDGVLIAINVRMPDAFEKGRRYPTIFEMSGYDGGSAGDRTVLGQYGDQFGYSDVPLGTGSRQLTQFFYRNYVTVHASVRGTGCSGGEFDLFSWRSALDGREAIEWISRQPWSGGGVGIMGHSYSGITGFMVAATRPPHLGAVTVSGLIDDLYRGISYPGGVINNGFPLIWTVGVRTAYDVLGGTAQAVYTTQDPVCVQNQATHRRTIVNDPVVQGVAGDTDNEWWRSRSLATYAHLIDVPIHMTGAHQDEQTGPRGAAHLFELVQGVPKRLLLTNGDHGTDVAPEEIWRDRLAWMEHWMRGADRGFGTLGEGRSSVTTFFEMHRARKGLRSNGRKDSRTFPVEDTEWTDYYLREGGELSTRPARGAEQADAYFSGSGRQSWSYQAGPAAGSQFTTPGGPDEVTYRSGRLRHDTAIVGPITATLYLSSTAPETDIFVQLIDEGPDGSRTYLQRGMLRASHRAYEPDLSDWDRSGGRRVLYRPYRHHTNPTEIVPGTVYRYLVEVFPVGHVFRTGHRIVVKVHAPPAVDSYYMYAPRGSVPSRV